MLSRGKRVDCPLQRLAVTAVFVEASMRAELASRLIAYIRHTVGRTDELIARGV